MIEKASLANLLVRALGIEFKTPFIRQAFGQSPYDKFQKKEISNAQVKKIKKGGGQDG
ncbi:MAG: hypothetical protein Q8O21_00255 [bacterium]|nr:hypothetical protein [bacterium]